MLCKISGWQHKEEATCIEKISKMLQIFALEQYFYQLLKVNFLDLNEKKTKEMIIDFCKKKHILEPINSYSASHGN